MNITLDEIRSKAPKGATHYIQNGNELYFLKRNNKKWLLGQDDGRFSDPSPIKIRWFFGWYAQAYSSIRHKIKPL